MRRMHRRFRRFKRKLPLYAFYLAIIAFGMAFAFPQEDPVPAAPPPMPQAISTPVTAVPLPQAQGVEPEIPGPAGAGGNVDETAWNLTLVNPWNALPEDYTFTETKLSNGQSVDERCYPDLQEMMDACRGEGLSPVICSAYRTREKQEALYQSKVDRLMAQGYSRGDAEVEAGKVVAVPGTSEHQLGLAVDIVDLNNQNLDTSQENTPVQKWLIAHSWEYGFILRYPSDKSEITGIIYEPWHYRYVGRDAAREINGLGVCLEEYLA